MIKLKGNFLIYTSVRLNSAEIVVVDIINIKCNLGSAHLMVHIQGYPEKIVFIKYVSERYENFFETTFTSGIIKVTLYQSHF